MRDGLVTSAKHDRAMREGAPVRPYMGPRVEAPATPRRSSPRAPEQPPQQPQPSIYVPGVQSGMYGIEVDAICVMSSHLHMVITDMRGELPRFLHQFDRLVALGMKVLRAWEGPF